VKNSLQEKKELPKCHRGMSGGESTDGLGQIKVEEKARGTSWFWWRKGDGIIRAHEGKP